MASLHIQREEQANTVTFRIEGTFDGQAALQLKKLLDEMGTRDVVLDFSRVREFFDLALPVIIRALEAHKIQFRGLARHQERMFRYFGIPSQPPVDRAYYKPEDILAV
jgi:hypothetical protein